MNKYDDYMADAFDLLAAGPECGGCVALQETTDCFGTGDSPSCYECLGTDHTLCPRTGDMERLAKDELQLTLTAIAENDLGWLLKAMKENKPEEIGYRLLEEL